MNDTTRLLSGMMDNGAFTQEDARHMFSLEQASGLLRELQGRGPKRRRDWTGGKES